MVDIQTERVLEAAIDHVYNNADCEIRDQCPILIAFVEILNLMKHANNTEIMDQIGYVQVKKCSHPCFKPKGDRGP